ncbi:MAG TPA: c-type cytochrome [Acidimicrobiales bacterium]|nr:c-type cytochrome [Acidimicrobiales bacterium]
MTEIPEHLLKRSRERRAAMGGDGDGGATDGGGGASQSSETAPAPTASTPAKAAASMPAHPAPESLPAIPPPSPMVEAHQRRRKVPFWAMPVLAALPLWAYVYQGTLSPPPAGEGPEVLGEELFASSGCAGCHGGGGGGGVGPAFTGGSIYETFPDFQTHFEWVRLGSAGWQAEKGDTYGANGKPVGGGMPGFGEDQLSDAELIYIVLHERLLGGENPNEEDMLALEEVALLMSENEGMTLDEAMAEVGVEAPEGDAAGGSEGNQAPDEGGGADQTGDAGSGGTGGDEPPAATAEPQDG